MSEHDARGCNSPVPMVVEIDGDRTNAQRTII